MSAQLTYYGYCFYYITEIAMPAVVSILLATFARMIYFTLPFLCLTQCLKPPKSRYRKTQYCMCLVYVVSQQTTILQTCLAWLTSDREYSSVLSPIVILMFGRTLGCLLKAKLTLAILLYSAYNIHRLSQGYNNHIPQLFTDWVNG